MDTGQSASVPVPLEDDFWEGIKRTLTGNGIDDEKADLIVALLKKSYEKRIINTQDEIIGVTDQLKLISINNIIKLNEQLEIIASRLEIPIIGISLTEQKVKKWRIIITYLFGAGVSIAAINAIVPIPFGLIANSVFAGGVQAARVFFSSFAGTGTNMTPEAIQNATAAAAAAQRGMVAGPSMDAVKAVGGIIGETLGSVIYTLSASALTTCVGFASTVVSAASTAVSGACHLLSPENANKIADLAVLSATVKGITVGIDNGWDFVKELNSGRLDAAIAEIIDKGPVDSATNAIINNILESTYDIEASKIDIKMDTKSAFDPKFKPPDRFLDVDVMDIIQKKLVESITLIEPRVPPPKNGSSKRIAIMEDLSALNKIAPNPVVVKELIDVYGMAVVMLYMILAKKSRKAEEGFGRNEKSSSLPDTTMFRSKKVKMPYSSDSMPGNFKLKEGLNPFVVAHNLKTQILKDAGYPDSKPIFGGYILDFTGDMNECMARILSEPMNPQLPGNLFTAINNYHVDKERQEKIRDTILLGCKEIRQGLDDPADAGLVPRIADKVRNIILNIEVDEPAAVAVESTSNFPGIFSKVSQTGTKKTGIEANYTRAPPTRPLKAINQQEAAKQEEAAINQQEEEKKRKRLGGSRRKSRRHKKKRSTLKRRRMKRRRTRKGKKRRHTRKH